MTVAELKAKIAALPDEASVWVGFAGESGPTAYIAVAAYADGDLIIAEESYIPSASE